MLGDRGRPTLQSGRVVGGLDSDRRQVRPLSRCDLLPRHATERSRQQSRGIPLGDARAITKKINGGLNGYDDRLNRYDKLGLAVCGYAFTSADIKLFQTGAKKDGFYDGEIDGDTGPKTRSAIHRSLVRLGSVPVAVTSAAPVTEPVPVKGTDKVALPRVAGAVAVVTPTIVAFGGLDNVTKFLLLGVGIAAVGLLLWKGEQIKRRVVALLGDGNAPT